MQGDTKKNKNMSTPEKIYFKEDLCRELERHFEADMELLRAQVEAVKKAWPGAKLSAGVIEWARYIKRGVEHPGHSVTLSRLFDQAAKSKGMLITSNSPGADNEAQKIMRVLLTGEIQPDVNALKSCTFADDGENIITADMDPRPSYYRAGCYDVTEDAQVIIDKNWRELLKDFYTVDTVDAQGAKIYKQLKGIKADALSMERKAQELARMVDEGDPRRAVEQGVDLHKIQIVEGHRASNDQTLWRAFLQIYANQHGDQPKFYNRVRQQELEPDWREIKKRLDWAPYITGTPGEMRLRYEFPDVFGLTMPTPRETCLLQWKLTFGFKAVWDGALFDPYGDSSANYQCSFDYVGECCKKRKVIDWGGYRTNWFRTHPGQGRKIW